MRLGCLLPFFEADGSPFEPGGLARAARRAAAAGFDGLWVPQAVGRGFIIPDPLIALAVAAEATEGVALGTAVLQVPLYHPADLAHRVASTALVCGDRLVLGVGAGSTLSDFETYGLDYAKRFDTYRDSVERLASFLTTGADGDSDLSIWPSVLGSPPLVLGSWGKGVGVAAQDYDGWMASARYRSDDEIVASIARFRELGGKRAIVSTIDPGTDLGSLGERLARFAESGFDDAVVLCHPGNERLDEIRALI